MANNGKPPEIVRVRQLTPAEQQYVAAIERGRDAALRGVSHLDWPDKLHALQRALAHIILRDVPHRGRGEVFRKHVEHLQKELRR